VKWIEMSKPGIESSEFPIRNVGVLGIGQMGASAAVLFCRAGMRVRLWTRDRQKLQNVQLELDRMNAFLDEHIGSASSQSGKIDLEPNLAVVDSQSEAILECVAEDMNQKQLLLKQLNHCRDQGKLVMSCTSGLSITEMASGSQLDACLVGAHFWNPPHLIPVVEVVSGKQTPPHQVELASMLLERADRIPIRCPDIPGFIGNRLMHAMWREALSLVDSGACTAEDIDRVVKWTFALRLPAIGPMENMDLVGHSLVEKVQRYLLPDLANNKTPAKALTAGLDNGQSGMAAGKGFYDWTARDAKSLIELRDRQIIRQLQFLRANAATSASPAAPA
jgi:3-hydroxybutyryl-CoA dehydrogenase